MLPVVSLSVNVDRETIETSRSMAWTVNIVPLATRSGGYISVENSISSSVGMDDVVGEAVGEDDGCLLGEDDGSLLGEDDGSLVGLGVGTRAGFGVGFEVGCANEKEVMRCARIKDRKTE